MIALAEKLKGKKCGKPSLYIRFMFRMMASAKKKWDDGTSAEAVYWKENGWLDQMKPWKEPKEEGK